MNKNIDKLIKDKNKRERRLTNNNITSENVDNTKVIEVKKSDVEVVKDKKTIDDTSVVVDGIPISEPKYDDIIMNPNTNGDFEEIEEIAESVNTLVNRRPLNKFADTYKLETFDKKVLYIFNQYKIEGYSKNREGTFKDVNEVKSVFGKFNFEFREFTDYTKKQIFDVLNAMKNEDFSDYGCLGIMILTHGQLNRKLWASDRAYSEDEVLRYFNSSMNPSLATKPKFLIVQACRGPKQSKAAIFQASMLSIDGDDAIEVYTLPEEADILVLHSTYYGSTAFRHLEQGSWFIQELCTYIKKYADKLDLYSIIVKVKNQVAINMTQVVRNRATSDLEYNKQMPVSVSTLTRSLELRKYDRIEEICENPVKVEDEDCSCVNKNFLYLKQKFKVYLREYNKDCNNVMERAVKHGELNGFDEAVLSKMMTEEMKHDAIVCKLCKFKF